MEFKNFGSKKVKYWFIKDSISFSDSLTNIQVKIRRKRKPRIAIGDRIIILNDSSFSMHCIVVDASENKEQNEEITEYTYNLSQFQEIASPNDLKSYAYSLQKIHKHFVRPYYHFIGAYGSFTEYDYDVITKQDYFISRTAFGRLINSLHPVHRSAFVNYATEMDSEAILEENKNYVQIFNLLKDYIEYSIINPANILKATNEILENDLGIKSEVGFSDVENLNRRFIIKRQVERIKQAENSVIENSSMESIANGIRELAEEEFEKNKQFKDKCLPINFNY